MRWKLRWKLSVSALGGALAQKERKGSSSVFSAMLVLPAYAILAVGPALALYAAFIGRRKPFLFLVTLAR